MHTYNKSMQKMHCFFNLSVLFFRDFCYNISHVLRIDFQSLRKGEQMMKRNIVLVGMIGSGKSHIGRKLARRLKWQFVDTDRRLERSVGMSIAEFYKYAGEKIFREKEVNILHQVSRYHEAVISFGGNFPMNVDTYRILHRYGVIVALASEPYRVEERVSRHIGKRPTVDYDNLHRFVRLMMKQWEEVYPYCDFTIDTTCGGASQIVEMIVKAIHDAHLRFAKREGRTENGGNT